MDKPAPNPAPAVLQWSGQTDLGKIRRNNEDSFLGLRFNDRDIEHLGKTGEASTENADFVFAVSDGMGGAHAGEFASRITLDRILRLLPRAYKQSALGMEAGFTDVLTELFHQIHNTLTFLGTSDPECAGMGATLSLCWFTPGWMHFGHIGDSRIYFLPAREGGIRQITRDDTHVGWLFRKGELNEREARNHPRRNALQNALGAGHQFVDPQAGSVAYENGDIFLLCTDGVVDGLYNDQLLDLLRGEHPGPVGPTPAERIVGVSVHNAGRDNTTAMVVRIG